MTDRVNYLTVALEHNMRDDDAQGLIDAIAMLRGVLTVAANVARPSDWIAERRINSALTEKLWEVLHPKDES